MNEPLKFKLFSVYGKVLHKDVLTEAFRKVKKNKGCAGIDKVSIKMFEENLDDNIDLILDELRTKTYRPSPVRRKYIPKKTESSDLWEYQLLKTGWCNKHWSLNLSPSLKKTYFTTIPVDSDLTEM